MTTRAKRAAASKAAKAAKVTEAEVSLEEGGGETVEQANDDDSAQPTTEVIGPSTVSERKG